MRSVYLLQSFFAVFLWAASRIIIKQSLVFISPYLLAGLVQLTAFLLLLSASAFQRRRLGLWPAPAVLPALILISLLGFAGAPLFAIVGLQYSSGVLAGLLAGLNAVLVLLIGAAVLGEKPRGWQGWGILVALLGAFLFISFSPTTGMFFGFLLLFLAETGFALTTVLMRRVMVAHSLSPLMISLVGSGVGTAILLPVGFLANPMPALTWPLLLAIVVLGGILAFASSLWYDALVYLKAFEASVLSATILPQIALLSFLFLGETMSGREILGGALVVLGAMLTELPSGLAVSSWRRAVGR